MADYKDKFCRYCGKWKDGRTFRPVYSKGRVYGHKCGDCLEKEKEPKK